MRRAGIIFVMAALAVLAGCKKFTAECDLVVQPYVMTSAGSDIHNPAYLVRVYAWYIDQKDIDNWAPRSYADADAGLVRHRTTGEVRSHGLAGVQGDDNYVHLTISRSPVVLVAVDPVNRFYAWRKFEYTLPLERILVPVTFKVFMGGQPYKENEWTVTGESSEKPPKEDGEE